MKLEDLEVGKVYSLGGNEISTGVFVEYDSGRDSVIFKMVKNGQGYFTDADGNVGIRGPVEDLFIEELKPVE